MNNSDKSNEIGDLYDNTNEGGQIIIVLIIFILIIFILSFCIEMSSLERFNKKVRSINLLNESQGKIAYAARFRKDHSSINIWEQSKCDGDLKSCELTLFISNINIHKVSH